MTAKLKKNNRGFSLVELLIAVVIMAVIVLPMLQVFTLSADFTRRSRDKGEATAAAQNIQETIQTRGVETFRAPTSEGFMQDSVALSMLGAAPIPNTSTAVDGDGNVTIRGVSVGSKTFDAVVNFDRNGQETNIGGVNKSIGLSINDKPIAKYTALTGTTSATFPQPYESGRNPDNLANQDFIAANPGAEFVKRARKINITVTSRPDEEKGSGYLVYVDVQFVYDFYRTASIKFPNPVEKNYPLWPGGQHIDSYDDEISLFFLYYAFYENTAAENIYIYVDRDNPTSNLKFKAFIIKQVPMIQQDDGTYINAIDAGDAGVSILNKDRSYKLVINEYHNNRFPFDYEGNPPPEAMNVYTNANKQLSNRSLDIADFKYRLKKPHTSGYFTWSKDTIARNQLVKTETEDRFFNVTIEIYPTEGDNSLDGEEPKPVYTLNANKLK